MNRNVSVVSVVAAMALLSVLFVVSVAFAEQDGGVLGEEKVTICHKGQTITVAEPAVQAHLKHGDTPGPCPTTTTTAAPTTTTVAPTTTTLLPTTTTAP